MCDDDETRRFNARIVKTGNLLHLQSVSLPLGVNLLTRTASVTAQVHVGAAAAHKADGTQQRCAQRVAQWKSCALFSLHLALQSS